jgi:glycerol-3-phosphate dehydrogenase
VNREQALAALRDARKPWDFVIVGGGATGLGCAVDAAARGHRIVLVEQNDFAKGTSSRSTKLVHGGVRYLRQGHLPLVLGALRERGLLCANAPHLVHRLAFVIPIYRWLDGPFYGFGLKLYDALSGRLSLGTSRWISRSETLRHLPTLEPTGLRGGVSYFDAQFDDARLAVDLAQTASGLGGVLINYTQVVRLVKENDRIRGIIARDEETGNEHELRGRVVINATGVFCDDLRRKDDPAATRLVAPSQGAHLVLPKRFLPGDAALMVPRTSDGRVLFAIPWHDRVLVGTTDIPIESTSLEPRPLAEEIDFLLANASQFLNPPLTRGDVLSVFAGLRPLVKRGTERSTAALSRDHTLLVSDSGLLTITGGKWTTYRKMAEDTINRAELLAALAPQPCRTHQLAIRGVETINLHLTPEPTAPLHPNLPYSERDVVRAIRHEMARTVEDVLARRTRALVLDARASVAAAPRVAQLIATELGRDESWERQSVLDFEALARGWMLER